MHFLTYLHSTFIKPFVLYIYFSDDKYYLELVPPELYASKGLLVLLFDTTTAPLPPVQASIN